MAPLFECQFDTEETKEEKIGEIFTLASLLTVHLGERDDRIERKNGKY